MARNKNPPTNKLLALCFGNMIEWYDFSLYLFFADPISRYFFNDHHTYHAKLLTYTVFLVGFLSRPLGGLVIGWLSDCYNPQTIMHRSIVMMGIATTLIALIPSAQTIGLLSPLCLIALRLIQGLSTGGQYPGLITMTVNRQHNRSSFNLGLMLGIATGGAALASMISWLGAWYFPHSHSSWTWRIPFLLSTIFLMIYLMMDSTEQTDEPNYQPASIRHLVSAFQQQFNSIIAVILMTIMGGSLYYLIVGYLVNYEIHQLHIPTMTARLTISLTLVAATILYPLMAWLADHLNHNKVFFTACALLLISIPPFMLVMHQHPSIAVMTLMTITITALVAAIQSTISPLFASTFLPRWRTSCCAISYNVGNAICGATPLLALLMTKAMPRMGLELTFFIVIGLGIMGYAMAKIRAPQTSENTLSEAHFQPDFPLENP